MNAQKVLQFNFSVCGRMSSLLNINDEKINMNMMKNEIFIKPELCLNEIVALILGLH